PPARTVELQAEAGEVPTGVYDPAVDIELMLLGGGVGGSHRKTGSVTGDALDLALPVPWRAIERVEDLHARQREPAGDLQPAQECLRLGGPAGGHEGAGSDASVARPGVAIVPVEVAPDLLGQRHGWRGDGRAGRRVGQLPQGDQTPDHGFPEGTRVLDRGG